MAKQVRPWLSKPDTNRELIVRPPDEESTSGFHQGQRTTAPRLKAGYMAAIVTCPTATRDVPCKPGSVHIWFVGTPLRRKRREDLIKVSWHGNSPWASYQHGPASTQTHNYRTACPPSCSSLITTCQQDGVSLRIECERYPPDLPFPSPPRILLRHSHNQIRNVPHDARPPHASSLGKVPLLRNQPPMPSHQRIRQTMVSSSSKAFLPTALALRAKETAPRR